MNILSFTAVIHSETLFLLFSICNENENLIHYFLIFQMTDSRRKYQCINGHSNS